MSAAFTPEWFDRVAPALAALPSAGDVDGVVQYVVSGTPEGKVTFHTVVEGGVVTDVASGKASGPTAVVSCSYDTALEPGGSPIPRRRVHGRLVEGRG